tara:strand:- start:4390 stop:5277 length:888 start_codon:yes stop_codon:yes gene_type:complete
MNLQTKSYKPTIKNGDYLFSDELTFPFPVEIHFTRMESFDNPNAVKVLVLSNESMMSPNRSTISEVIDNHKKYDLILGTDDEIIVFCENAKKFPYGSTWLNRGNIKHPDGLGRYEDNSPSFDGITKDFSVSFLASWYNLNRPGYALRQQVWNRKEEIPIARNFYTSVKCFSNAPTPLPGGEKEVLFDSQYHICIENHAIGNYFTEKLIDSFLTLSIPIYWGCTNIEDYFDVDGMILFDTIDDLLEKLNDITPEHYFNKLDVMKENKKRAIEYANFDERIFKEIIKHDRTNNNDPK